jgi:hypothetical protein
VPAAGSFSVMLSENLIHGGIHRQGVGGRFRIVYTFSQKPDGKRRRALDGHMSERYI